MINNSILEHYKQIEKLSKLNKKLAKKLLRLIFLLKKKIKIYRGPNDGIFYYTKNKTKIYLN